MNRQRRIDVAVIGDGPAGSAVAAACAKEGIDTLLIGGDSPWSATYGAWIDDLDDVELIDVDSVMHPAHSTIAVHAQRTHVLNRAYGVFDNRALLRALRSSTEHLPANVDRVEIAAKGGGSSGPVGRHRIRVGTGETVLARAVIDATGWPATFAEQAEGHTGPAWQTALGVVLREPPSGDLGEPTLMDFRPVRRGGVAPSTQASTIGPAGVPTFCYSLPVSDGWLVEETVLAARPAVEPIALLARLAGRLGRHPDDLLAAAVRTEYVRIPMGGPRPRADQPIVAYGTAAGRLHPTTGFSVGASLRAAPRVASAVAAALDTTPAGRVIDTSGVWSAVWPRSAKRTRTLHEFGLEMLLGLDGSDMRSFFDAFFSLPTGDWAPYLRVDAPPSAVGATMMKVFTSASWRLRRRLMAPAPATFVRLLRP